MKTSGKSSVKINRGAWFCLALAGLWLAPPAGGLEIFVANGGQHIAPFGDWTSAATNLTEALDLANTSAPPNTVWISNGVYTLSATVYVTNVTVKSASGQPGDVVVNGNGLRCFYVNHAEAVLDGLTISNGNAGAAPGAGYGSGVYLLAGVVRNCRITDNVGGGASGGGCGIYCSGAQALVSNCFFAGNLGSAHSGGGIYISAGMARACIFSNNNARYDGGGAYMVNGTLADSEFYDNIAARNGGGVFIGAATAAYCLVSGNVSSNHGAGVYLNATNSFFINSTAAFNQAVMSGGGIYIFKGMASNCLIVSNYAADSVWGGGGLYLGGTSFVENCTIASNSCLKMGGGIVARVNAGLVKDCRLLGNAANDGGGIYHYGDSGVLTVRDSLIAGNTALTNGGGVHGAPYAPGITLSNCVIADNIAKSGGGLYFSAYNTAIGCTISGNLANNSASYVGGGGACFWTGGTLRNCLLVNNSATGATACGGGLFSMAHGGNRGEIQNCTIVSNYAASQAGGFYFYNGTVVISTGHVDNCIIYSNLCTTPTYNNWRKAGVNELYVSNSCTVPSISAYGENNITNEPLFADAANADYRLAPGSPCIDAGVNLAWMPFELDLGRHQRIDRFSRRVDMGAYEYVAPGVMFSVR